MVIECVQKKANRLIIMSVKMHYFAVSLVKLDESYIRWLPTFITYYTKVYPNKSV